MYKCKCELDKCLECPNVALNKKLCTKCNINYFPKENDPLNIGEYINCYKEPEGYYLDNNLYRKCYYTCKTCNISGNNITHNCIECNEDNPTEIKINNYSNCYQKCNFYYYFDLYENYHCTINNICPEEYPILVQMECKFFKIKNFIQKLINNEQIKKEYLHFKNL